jgi:predicted membrane protein DUF2232
MTADRGEGRWRLILGTIAFALWGPLSLVGLPLAGMLVACRPRTRTEWGTAAAVAVPSLGLLVLPESDLLTGFVRAYIVLVTAAFVILAALARGDGRDVRVLPLAVRASLVGGTATVALATVGLDGSVWSALHWEATRAASATMRLLVQIEPRTFVLFEPVVRFVSDTVPGTLALQTLAGLALAWQWHRRVARNPLGPPLARFREFRFGDHWVWAVVLSLGACVAPVLAALKLAAVNVLIVLGTLYLVRGIAIVVAFSAAVGIAPAALVIGAAVSAVLAVPLLVLVPALATLGVTDTWLEFRRRLKASA